MTTKQTGVGFLLIEESGRRWISPDAACLTADVSAAEPPTTMSYSSKLENFNEMKAAFASGARLSRRQRRSALSHFAKPISVTKAAEVLVAYARGQVHESGQDLVRLVQAWLIFGEKFWSKLFWAVQCILDLVGIFVIDFAAVAEALALERSVCIQPQYRTH